MPILNDLNNELESYCAKIAECENNIKIQQESIRTQQEILQRYNETKALLERLIESANADSIPTAKSPVAKPRTRTSKPKPVDTESRTTQPAENEIDTSGYILMKDLAAKLNVQPTVIASVSNELELKLLSKDGKYMLTPEQANAITDTITNRAQ